MEAAYDHIQEETLHNEEEQSSKPSDQQSQPEASNLNTDIKEAYNSLTTSAWGTRLGGLWGTVQKQGQDYYNGVRQEATVIGGGAIKGFSDLSSSIVSRARSLSLHEPGDEPAKHETVENGGKNVSSEPSAAREADAAIADGEGILSRLRTEAAKRLKDLEKAEDAADEALLKFGTNIRDFLRGAVSVAPPDEETGTDASGNATGKVLFESKDAEGKRVIHTTRFDAQLHVIHVSLDSFTKDPMSKEYEKWVNGGENGEGKFDIDEKTDDIAKDLEKYEELRRAMEKLVPEQVDYGTFWKRYYFLRMVLDEEENKRREMLKGAAMSRQEEVAWDEDSDDEPSTPQPRSSIGGAPTTPKASKAATSGAGELKIDSLKPLEGRKSSDEKSQPDSDTSYDIVSTAPSAAPSSPRNKDKVRQDESDEEDWE